MFTLTMTKRKYDDMDTEEYYDQLSEISPALKKRRIINQLKSGFVSPPKCINTLTPINGVLQFKCENKDNNNHTINISIDNNNITFDCDCMKKYNQEQINSECCSHINAALLKIMNCYVENSEKYVNLKNSIKYMRDDFDALSEELLNISL